MLKVLGFVVLTLLSTAVAKAEPVTATIVGPDGDILYYECALVDQGQMACDFVQVSFSNRARQDDLDAELLDVPVIVADADGELEKTCGQFDPLLFDYFRLGPGHPLPESIAGLQDRAALEKAVSEDWGYVSNAYLTLEKLCKERSEEAATAFVKFTHHHDTETCIPFVNRYSQTFVMVTENLWVVDSSPSGLCGVVNTSRFSRPDGGLNFEWEYTAQKFVTNKPGLSELALSCSILDEAAYLYTYLNGPTKIDCVYLD